MVESDLSIANSPGYTYNGTGVVAVVEIRSASERACELDRLAIGVAERQSPDESRR